MIKKVYSNIDVVRMARIRIKNVFESAPRVELSISGGKDSICLNNLIFEMCQNGEIDKSKLVVDFIDEEAIYPCIERIVKNMRLQWLSIGVEFRWWCIQVKHYNCFNQLSNDESFICWDETKRDVWIRPMPSFALTSDPVLKPRKDTYQDFMNRKLKGYVSLIGVRASESLQRLYNIANRKAEEKIFPIYDWLDSDVWNYIRERNLDFPEAYKYMYQVGVGLGKLRISQFFSIDTASSLVQMCEFYPELFDKICKREPNAYMAMLYFDSEMFRRNKEKKQKTEKTEKVDHKARLMEMMNESWRFESKSMKTVHSQISRLLLKYGPMIREAEYKDLCQVVIAGDPKRRSLRAIEIRMLQNK